MSLNTTSRPRMLSVPATQPVPCPECGATTLEVARGRFGPIRQCSSPFCAYWWSPPADATRNAKIDR